MDSSHTYGGFQSHFIIAREDIVNREDLTSAVVIS
jgi:hypothetical protein